MNHTEFHHISILLDECLDALQIRPDGTYMDATLGGAGHSLRIAQRLGQGGRLICIDRDDEALANARKRLAPVWDRVTLAKSDFRALDEVLAAEGLDGADGILFDLGVSSPQLDEAERGFSYMHDAPLDMRMDRQQTLTAYDVVNTWSREDIRRILFEYGEERYAPLIAAAIERRRAEQPVETTRELAALIRGAMPAAALREKQHPAKRSFQAIRIAVNDELGAVREAMGKAIDVLKPGGAAGRHHLPLAGGPHCKGSIPVGGAGLHLSARFPGVRVREKAACKTHQPQTHPAGGGGSQGKCAGALGEAARV